MAGSAQVNQLVTHESAVDGICLVNKGNREFDFQTTVFDTYLYFDVFFFVIFESK